MSEGYIKLYRKFLDWEWWQDHNTLVVFLYLLMTVNFSETTYKNRKIGRGQGVYTVKDIATNNMLTNRQTRTSLEHLKSTNEICVDTSPQYSIITVNNYDKYQIKADSPTNKNEKSDKQPDNQTTNNLTNLTNIKEEKKERSKEYYPPNPPTGGDDGFMKFWEAYPRKTNKSAAGKAWSRLNPGEDLLRVILEAISQQKTTRQWQEENGRFIPNPAKWIVGRYWENTVSVSTEPRSYDLDEIEKKIREGKMT